MKTIGILYHTTDGHTLTIGEYLKNYFVAQKNKVVMLPIAETTATDLAPLDIVVIGASIRYGKHSGIVTSFMEKDKAVLTQKATAFFSVNLVARNADKNTPETNVYCKKFLEQLSWQPTHTAVFAGVLDYSIYKFWDRFMIRLIMRITKGPVHTQERIVYTRWERVMAFATQLLKN